MIQFRFTEKETDDGPTKIVRPYVMDLGSTNGTFVNGEKVTPTPQPVPLHHHHRHRQRQ